MFIKKLDPKIGGGGGFRTFSQYTSGQGVATPAQPQPTPTGDTTPPPVIIDPTKSLIKNNPKIKNYIEEVPQDIDANLTTFFASLPKREDRFNYIQKRFSDVDEQGKAKAGDALKSLNELKQTKASTQIGFLRALAYDLFYTTPPLSQAEAKKYLDFIQERIKGVVETLINLKTYAPATYLKDLFSATRYLSIALPLISHSISQSNLIDDGSKITSLKLINTQLSGLYKAVIRQIGELPEDQKSNWEFFQEFSRLRLERMREVPFKSAGEKQAKLREWQTAYEGLTPLIDQFIIKQNTEETELKNNPRTPKAKLDEIKRLQGLAQQIKTLIEIDYDTLEKPRSDIELAKQTIALMTARMVFLVATEVSQRKGFDEKHLDSSYGKLLPEILTHLVTNPGTTFSEAVQKLCDKERPDALRLKKLIDENGMLKALVEYENNATSMTSLAALGSSTAKNVITFWAKSVLSSLIFPDITQTTFGEGHKYKMAYREILSMFLSSQTFPNGQFFHEVYEMTGYQLKDEPALKSLEPEIQSLTEKLGSVSGEIWDQAASAVDAPELLTLFFGGALLNGGIEAGLAYKAAANQGKYAWKIGSKTFALYENGGRTLAGHGLGHLATAAGLSLLGAIQQISRNSQADFGWFDNGVIGNSAQTFLVTFGSFFLADVIQAPIANKIASNLRNSNSRLSRVLLSQGMRSFGHATANTLIAAPLLATGGALSGFRLPSGTEIAGSTAHLAVGTFFLMGGSEVGQILGGYSHGRVSRYLEGKKVKDGAGATSLPISLPPGPNEPTRLVETNPSSPEQRKILFTYNEMTGYVSWEAYVGDNVVQTGGLEATRGLLKVLRISDWLSVPRGGVTILVDDHNIASFTAYFEPKSESIGAKAPPQPIDRSNIVPFELRVFSNVQGSGTPQPLSVVLKKPMRTEDHANLCVNVHAGSQPDTFNLSFAIRKAPEPPQNLGSWLYSGQKMKDLSAKQLREMGILPVPGGKEYFIVPELIEFMKNESVFPKPATQEKPTPAETPKQNFPFTIKIGEQNPEVLIVTSFEKEPSPEHQNIIKTTPIASTEPGLVKVDVYFRNDQGQQILCSSISARPEHLREMGISPDSEKFHQYEIAPTPGFSFPPSAKGSPGDLVESDVSGDATTVPPSAGRAESTAEGGLTTEPPPASIESPTLVRPQIGIALNRRFPFSIKNNEIYLVKATLEAGPPPLEHAYLTLKITAENRAEHIVTVEVAIEGTGEVYSTKISENTLPGLGINVEDVKSPNGGRFLVRLQEKPTELRLLIEEPDRPASGGETPIPALVAPTAGAPAQHSAGPKTVTVNVKDLTRIYPEGYLGSVIRMPRIPTPVKPVVPPGEEQTRPVKHPPHEKTQAVDYKELLARLPVVDRSIEAVSKTLEGLSVERVISKDPNQVFTTSRQLPSQIVFTETGLQGELQIGGDSIVALRYNDAKEIMPSISPKDVVNVAIQGAIVEEGVQSTTVFWVTFEDTNGNPIDLFLDADNLKRAFGPMVEASGNRVSGNYVFISADSLPHELKENRFNRPAPKNE